MPTFSLEIPFTRLSYSYIPLPDGYPVQPFTAQQFQPAVYTQSKGQEGNLSVLLPLPGNLGVSLPETLQVDADEESTLFTLTIILTQNENLDEEGRLAMISLGTDFPDSVSTDGKWQILVVAPVSDGLVTAFGGKIVGKVVMDSNIYPT